MNQSASTQRDDLRELGFARLSLQNGISSTEQAAAEGLSDGRQLVALAVTMGDERPQPNIRETYLRCLLVGAIKESQRMQDCDLFEGHQKPHDDTIIHGPANHRHAVRKTLVLLWYLSGAHKSAACRRLLIRIRLAQRKARGHAS